MTLTVKDHPLLNTSHGDICGTEQMLTALMIISSGVPKTLGQIYESKKNLFEIYRFFIKFTCL
jgi:hypothetical protein